MASFGKHFQVIFEHSPVGILIFDLGGMILLANRIASGMLKCPEKDLHSQYLKDLLYPEDAPLVAARFADIAKSPNSGFETECRYLRGKEVRWVQITLNHVGAGDFSPFIFGLLKDITQQKSGLDRLLREKENAEKATQTKSAFLANMSHEIRTPIHTVTGMTELLLETKLDEEQKEYANQIKYSAEVLLGLINDILDFSKIEAGKLTLEVVDCDLVSLIEEAVDMVSLLAHKKNLEVIIDIARDVPRWVIGDPVRIRQIIINLFNNAVKFTQAGEIILRAGLVRKEGNKSLVKIEVIDTGIGIPEDKLKLLFQAFTQVDSSTTRKFGGTGLGLSISKSLVRMMNGSIKVESELGRGSNFSFILPLLCIEDHEEEAEAILEDIHSQTRVLIIDDNEPARRVLLSHLSNWFRRVETAANGPAAFTLMRRAKDEGDPYGLGFVDLHIPGMDGWQFASEVKNDSTLGSTPLILLSPMGSGTEAKMKLLGWFAGYINKPVKRTELLETISAVFSGTGTESSGRPTGEKELNDSALNRSRHILVAEDHPVNQQLFCTILEKMGYSVSLASNGLEAVRHAESGNIDLVFMDVQMPEMNGYEASMKIRELGIDVPIVAVTANALKGEREKCLSVGMNDYLTKPFKSKDLLPYLEKYLPASEPEEAEEIIDVLEPETSGPDKAVFDYASAQDSFMGQKAVVIRVVKAFQKKVEAQLLSMKTALDGGEWKPLGIESHGIKGGAWNLQAKRLGDAAALLEQAAKDEDAVAAAAQIEAVRREYEVFREVVAGMTDFREP